VSAAVRINGDDNDDEWKT